MFGDQFAVYFGGSASVPGSEVAFVNTGKPDAAARAWYRWLRRFHF